MQISKISNSTFGASPDLNTRKLLINLELKGANTKTLQRLMKEVYADKYVVTKVDSNDNLVMGIYDIDNSHGDLKIPVVSFSERLNIKNSNLLGILTGRFNCIKNNRSAARVRIDEMENYFGRYTADAEAYYHSSMYKS